LIKNNFEKNLNQFFSTCQLTSSENSEYDAHVSRPLFEVTRTRKLWNDIETLPSVWNVPQADLPGSESRPLLPL